MPVVAEIPGPRAPMALQSLHYGLAPYDFFQRPHRRFGDVFRVSVAGSTWIVLGAPEAVREVFALGYEAVDAGEANRPLGALLGTRNLLLLDGEQHLARRRLVLPPFHGESLRAYEDVVESVAARRLSAWPDGRTVPVLPIMQGLTLEVVLRAVFGVKDGARREELSRRLRRLLAWTTDLRRALVFSLLGPERLAGLRALRRQRAAVDAMLLTEIAARRGDPALGERRDVLSGLLRARTEDGRPLSDRDLCDELLTLLVAGHETTAALLAWALHELARAPDVLERLAAGEPGPDRAVVHEALRLHPPVPLGALRRLWHPVEVAGHLLPAGTIVAPCAAIIHRRADLWPEPEEFSPDRFLGIRPSPGTWLPFGGGTRRCVGAAFAEQEARLVLGAVARRFSLTAHPRRREWVGRRGIVLVPGRGGARPRHCAFRRLSPARRTAVRSRRPTHH